MSDAQHFLTATDPAQGLTMPTARTWIRIRAGRKTDSTNPAATVADWTRPDETAIRGFLSSSSSTRTPGQTGEQTDSTAVLTIPDPTADIRIGDRIRAHPDDGRLWRVDGFPAADTSPFTGFRPTIEARLTETTGGTD